MKEKMNQKELLIGSMVSEVSLPNLMRIYKVGGLDFVIVDCEHGQFSFPQLADMVAVANAVSLPVIVRIPDNHRENVLKMLELGADGLLLPMADTPESLSQVVRFGKYPPIGKRGLATSRPHCNYNMDKVREYLEKANRRTMIFGQVETREALENCADLLAIEGVDGLFIGPNDLSVDLGIPGDVSDPMIMDAVRRVHREADLIGKQLGVITSNPTLLQNCYEEGLRLFSISSETGMVLKSVKNIAKTFSKR